MIAVDSQILIYAHRAEAAWHAAAKAAVRSLAEGRARWAVPWPCVHEFLSIVTHPRIYDPPTPTEAAFDQIDAWLESPSVSLLGEAEDHSKQLRAAVLAAKIAGPRIHDARIAAMCLSHGVDELWTADRDFSRFPALKCRNPLIAPGLPSPAPRR